ncbi:hypothetical protein L917_01269, partial [Phytophthora nicotianae]
MIVFAAIKASVQGSGFRRATSSRLQEAASTIDGYLLERSNIQVGPIARSYWDITHARQPGGTEPSQPTSATFRQMQHLDSKLSEPQSTGAEPEFRVVTVRINGSTNLQLSANVQEIRALVG